MRNDEDITTTAYRTESNSDGYLHWDIYFHGRGGH